MSDDGKLDYYEILQVSANAEPDTIHRIYRLLAQRFHPDNQESGNSDRFHQIHEAYTVLSDAGAARQVRRRLPSAAPGSLASGRERCASGERLRDRADRTA